MESLSENEGCRTYGCCVFESWDDQKNRLVDGPHRRVFSFLAIENPHLEDQRGDKNIILVIQLHFNGFVDSRGFASGFDFNVGVRDGGSENVALSTMQLLNTNIVEFVKLITLLSASTGSV